MGGKIFNYLIYYILYIIYYIYIYIYYIYILYLYIIIYYKRCSLHFIDVLLISFNYSHFRLILTPRREVIHSNFKAYEVNADGKEKTIHLGMI